MPTLVRSVRKVVLFVLVMAVSGVGVAQAQTDPDVVPTSAEAADSSDMARQSAWRYVTGEQVSRATTSGGLTYMATVSLEVSDGWILHKAVWDFYSINGDETNFFVDTVTTAQQIRLDEEFQIKGFEAILYTPILAEGSPATRLVSWAPDSEVRLPDEGADTIFSVTYEPEDAGEASASISRRVPASPNTLLESSTLPDPQNDQFYHNTSVYYAASPTNTPEIFVGGSVAHWNSGSPQGMEVAIRGEAVSSITGETHRWSRDKPVEIEIEE